VRKVGRLPSWAERRLDRAIQLQPGGGYIIPWARGPRIGRRPSMPADSRFSSPPQRFDIWWSGPSGRTASWLRNVPAAPLGNAFFWRAVHADPKGLRRLLIITSGFHLRPMRGRVSMDLRPGAESAFLRVVSL